MRELTYRVFVSDALFHMNNNVANTLGGVTLSCRFYDFLNLQPKETRTSDDIINDIKEKLGGL